MMYEALVIIGAPIARGVAGWAENALQDGKITTFEYQQLFTTVLKLGIPAVALYFGLNLDAEMAASIPIIADYLFSYISKAIKNSKVQPTI